MSTHTTERRVLIIGREIEALAPLQSSLLQAGFKARFPPPGEDPRAAVDHDRPHLIVIDWDLPAAVALDLVRHVRRERCVHSPRLIALSQFAGEHRVESVLELGIDDYVLKPFSLPELLARVRAVLRPLRDIGGDALPLQFEALQLDLTGQRLIVRNQTIPIPNLEFRLLHFLMQRPERPCSRELLLQQIWSAQGEISLRAVDVTFRRLRRVLSRCGCECYIRTVRGVGYQLSRPTRSSSLS